MAKLYTVLFSNKGFTRNDPDVPKCAGIFSKEEVANAVAKIIGGTVYPIEVDYIPKGYAAVLKDNGYAAVLKANGYDF